MTELRFGKYQVDRPLEKGGMGEVYLGRATGAHGFARPVVIKTIRSELVSDPRAAMMFVDEARIAARLHHRNIVQILDFDVVDEGAFLVTEYVDGTDLRGLLRHLGAPPPYEIAIAIIAELATGLHAAHEARDDEGVLLDLVHRDLTPSNVLLGVNGEVKLADFGIARARSRSYHTVSGSIKGKAAYMAPEQILGEPLDRRADLFALGVLMYEITTRARLFSGRGDALAMRAILDGAIPDPAVHRAGYPPELTAVLRRALARDRDHRYATAAQLVADLDAIAAARGWAFATSRVGRLAGAVKRRASTLRATSQGVPA